MKVFALVMLTALPAVAGQHHRQQFAERIGDRLDKCNTVLHLTRASSDWTLGYTQTQFAYRQAIDDLEEYQGGNRAISEERLENDASEVEDDLGGRMSVEKAVREAALAKDR